MKVVIIGSGNAALCAGISALENGAEVMILEAAGPDDAGGNSKYTAGAMRFEYTGNEELLPLLNNPKDERITRSEFGTYSKERFQEDLLSFNEGRPLSLQQNILIDKSYETMRWLSTHQIKFEPIYDRQSFEKEGKHIFWGGLTLAAEGEGVGLVAAELREYKNLGGHIKYNTRAIELLTDDDRMIGVRSECDGDSVLHYCNAVILACGGFEANQSLRQKYLGAQWAHASVRGSRYNQGAGIEMALKAGAQFEGNPEGCHAVPMDMHMPNYGNPSIPFIERKNYRKICYFLGIMINANGNRFVDEGINFRNYTYAQFGKAILEQPGGFAWQLFDKKVDHLLYEEYNFWDASYVQADSLKALVKKMENVDHQNALKTINEYNLAVGDSIKFDPTILDRKCTSGLAIEKSNWANKLDQPPYKAFPVKCGITFTYGGLKVDRNAQVINKGGAVIPGLFACGELVGGVFYNGYPGGSGLTSGAVFGRIAGRSAAISKE